MTASAYKRIKAMLLEQKRLVTNSPEAAAQLLTDLGIRDFLVDVSSEEKETTKKKAVAEKATHPKTATK